METKKCQRCYKNKPITQFQIGRKGQPREYRYSYCNECRNRRINLNLNNNVNCFLSDRYNRLVIRARKNHILCTITKAQFIAQYHKQNGLCFYTDKQMSCKLGNKLTGDSLSIDKLIPKNGYVLGNLVFATHRVNTSKSNFSLEEMRLWMPLWYTRIFNFLTPTKITDIVNEKG